MMEKKRLLSMDITLGPYDSFIDRIDAMCRERRAGYICVANVHMLVEAHQDENFAKVVNQATMVTPDGMPLTWGLKLMYGLKQDRVAGMDLLPDLLERFSTTGTPVFLYGGTQAMLDQATAYIQQHYPSVRMAGAISPPFRPLTPEEKDGIIEQINGSGAGMVFVALGCPKQEKWMHEMQGKLSPMLIGIGGALPVMVGMQKRAPRWMQRSGLEWLYRLGQEPKRLFKRYFTTNTLFLWLLFKARVKAFARIQKSSEN